MLNTYAQINNRPKVAIFTLFAIWNKLHLDSKWRTIQIFCSQVIFTFIYHEFSSHILSQVVYALDWLGCLLLSWLVVSKLWSLQTANSKPYKVAFEVQNIQLYVAYTHTFKTSLPPNFYGHSVQKKVCARGRASQRALKGALKYRSALFQTPLRLLQRCLDDAFYGISQINQTIFHVPSP